MTDRLPELVEDGRLRLRRWEPADAATLHVLITESTDHLRPWMAWISFEPQAVDDRRTLLEAWDQEWRSGGDAVFAIERHGTVVGSAGLHRRIGPQGLEIGYWVHPGHLRRGVATSTSELLTTAALDLTGIDHVEIHHDKANVASAAVPLALGYERVGEQPKAPVAPAEVGIDCTWRMTAGAWTTWRAARQ
jgi:RimJ/RimL family protein N-acetyltransferase